MSTARLARPQHAYSAFADDVRAGLSRPQKSLPAKWFYDAEGSRLFQLISKLPEYYPTRTEIAILKQHAASIGRFVGPEATIVEYGGGSSEKAALLASNLEAPKAYVCIEIESGAAADAARGVAAAVPELKTSSIVGDFTALDHTAPILPAGARIGFFSGSTIGNFPPVQAALLLAAFRRHLGPRARLIVGFDQVKPVGVLLPAYDDAAGVTAAFNKNLLARINRELDGDIDLDAFSHEARWNPHEDRIEMHLVSLSAQTIVVGGEPFDFRCGETIHTENSYKFTPERIEGLAHAGGWHVDHLWTDPRHDFAVAGFSRRDE